MYFLKGIEITAKETIAEIRTIKEFMDEIGVLEIKKIGKENVFINKKLMKLLRGTK